MQTSKLMLATFAAGMVLVTSAAVVTANEKLVETKAETTVEQKQELTNECTTTGSYGQNVTCKNKGKQSQKATAVATAIVYKEEGTVAGVSTTKTHIPADTALSTEMMAAVFGLGLSGVAAFAGYVKIG